MNSYFDHAGGVIPRDVFELAHNQRSSQPYEPKRGDVIEFDAVQVLEGEAAEISNRAFLAEQERRDAERAVVLTP